MISRRHCKICATSLQRNGAMIEARAAQKLTGEQTLAQRQASFGALRSAVENAEAAVTQSRIRNAALGEKRENTHANLANRLSQRDATAQEIASWQNRGADCQRQRKEIAEALAQTEAALSAGREELQVLESRLQTDRQNYRSISMQLAELGETIKELRPLGESCQEERSQIQLALAEKRLNLQHLADNLREKYDTDLESLTAPAGDDPPSRDQLLLDIEDLRGRLERMGEVNLAAIGEYEELTSRFQFMSRQKEDLEKSIADLQQTIVKLNRICRLRFKESFEAINEKFEVIFPRLFRGGKAKLVLTDENDFLETGVDIVVQPPGKKLQSITLFPAAKKRSPR